MPVFATTAAAASAEAASVAQAALLEAAAAEATATAASVAGSSAATVVARVAGQILQGRIDFLNDKQILVIKILHLTKD